MFRKPEDPLTAYEAAGSTRRHGTGPDGTTYRSRVIVGSVLAVLLLWALAWLGGFGRDVPDRRVVVPVTAFDVAPDGQAQVTWTDTQPCVTSLEPTVEFDPTVEPATVTLTVREVAHESCADPSARPERTMMVTVPPELRDRTLVDGACDDRRHLADPICFDPERG